MALTKKEQINQAKLEAAHNASSYEVKKWVFVEDPETGETKRFRRPRMTIISGGFAYKASLRKGMFRVLRFAEHTPKADTPTMFRSWLKVSILTKHKWTLHGVMDATEFFLWLKTSLGGNAYLAFAEIVS